MALVLRVLSLAKRVSSSRHQFVALPTKSYRTISNKKSSSISNPLLVKLMQEPNSGVKTALNLEENSIPKADTLFWESLLPILKSSSPEKAQLVLEWKLEKILKENERDQSRYSELIILCGKVQHVTFAVQVFTSMEARGVRPTAAVFNSLITTCLSSGNVATALSLFEIMERSKDFKPNSTTYNAFISMYSKSGDGKAMQAWYSASKTVGFSPTVQTFESLISWCIKSKEFDIANTFYDEMMSLGVTPNVAILENMLEGLCKQKKLNKIQQFLKFVLDGGWKVNKKMAEILLELYSQTARVGEMEELLVSLMKFNQEAVVLSQVHCGIIRMYALSDRLDDLEYSVGRMLKQGGSFTCAGDVEQVICSYFRRAAYDRLDLFLEHIEGSYKLTKSTYDLLVAGYKRAGLSDKLDLVMKKMKLADILYFHDDNLEYIFNGSFAMKSSC